MKFRVIMKCPDALWEAVVRENPNGDTETIMTQCQKWFRHEELLTVEIDTEANTCVVVPCQT